MEIKTIFIFANVIFSIIAACLWVYACIVNVEPVDSDNDAKEPIFIRLLNNKLDGTNMQLLLQL
jgi:hypothetical protein